MRQIEALSIHLTQTGGVLAGLGNRWSSITVYDHREVMRDVAYILRQIVARDWLTVFRDSQPQLALVADWLDEQAAEMPTDLRRAGDPPLADEVLSMASLDHLAERALMFVHFIVDKAEAELGDPRRGPNRQGLELGEVVELVFWGVDRAWKLAPAGRMRDALFSLRPWLRREFSELGEEIGVPLGGGDGGDGPPVSLP